MSELEYLLKKLCPGGVEYKKIGDISFVQRGKRLTKDKLSDENEYPVFHGGLEPLGYYCQYNRDAETTMIINVGASAGTVVYSDKKFWSSDGCYCISHNEYTIPKYIYLVLSTKEKYLMSKIRRAGIPTLDAKIIEELAIPVPPIEVQHEVVRILDHYTVISEELVGIKEREIELTIRKKESLCNLILTDALSKAVDSKEIKDICEFVTVGIANSATHAYSDSGVILFRNQNIKENYLDDSDLIYITQEFAEKYSQKSLKENDILITRTGYPGQACIVPAKYSGSQTFTTLIARLKDFRKVNPKFVCYYINSSYGKEYVNRLKTGAAQKNFGAKALEKMPIKLPSIEKQNEAVRLFEIVNGLFDELLSLMTTEIEDRQTQYIFYRNKLLTFKNANE